MSFLQPGSVFGKDFRIIRHLSSGGMGSVFVVEQLSTGKERALKVMHTEFHSPALLDERLPVYLEVAETVVDTDGRTPEQVANEIEAALKGER